MPKYTCERCLKEFSQKSHYDKHMNKKRPCQDNKVKIEQVVENIINKKLISNNTELTEETIMASNPNTDPIEKSITTEQHINEPNISLFKGDCLDVMNQITNKSIDLILCDLPYGVTKNKWDVVIPFDMFSVEWDEATGDQKITCAKDPYVCPDIETLQDIEVIAIWGEGA